MAGTWAPLANQPTFAASTMLLLTDGTVMCQDQGTANWWRLTPDRAGNYVNGTWSTLASMPNAPLYYASAVLKDGTVFVAGGEYESNRPDIDLLAAELYDPPTNAWIVLPTPSGWTNIGDAPCCVLPDGRLLLGSIKDRQAAIFDPVLKTWIATAPKDDPSSEETWTLLPDQTVLAVECTNHPAAEKYVPASNQWVSAGRTLDDLVEAASIEIGPAILLPDGRVFAIGATGFTALYSMPSLSISTGIWSRGPQFRSQIPNQILGAKDAPACLLPNGRVFCVAGPVDGTSGNYLSPTYFFEFDPVSGQLARVPDPPNSSGAPYVGRMLLLPSGQVLFANGSNDVEVYTPDGNADLAWRPRITACPTNIVRGQVYELSGTQINGLSQAVSYGDDASMATNYPLVRIRCTTAAGVTTVTYCRTSNHSTMGVATGLVVQKTTFAVPQTLSAGAGQLVVVANGIESDPFAVQIS
jgi:hypothetical protein